MCSFGNGRWSRLAADVLITQLGAARFTWGGANLQTAGDARKRYIEALHAAEFPQAVEIAHERHPGVGFEAVFLEELLPSR